MAVVAAPTFASLAHLCKDPRYDQEAPYEVWADEVPAQLPRTNVKLELIHDVPVTDVRTLGSLQPKLETHGFEWLHHPFPTDTGIKGADDISFGTPDRRQGLEMYLASTVDLLKSRLGCEKVLCWDWRVRRTKSTEPRSAPNIYSLKGKEGHELRATQINSSHIIHADGSPAFMQSILDNVTTEDEREWTRQGKYRVRSLTLWRPLVDIVQTDPLVLCDTQTLQDDDWDVVQKVLDKSVEESMYLRRQERHKWYWMSDQSKDDVIVMTIWDSKRPEQKSTAVPHCAMVLRDTAADVQPRESVEVRVFAWTTEESSEM